MEVIDKLKKTYRSSTDTSSNKYLMVPIFIFFALLIFALIRSPILISQSGIGSAIMLTAPLILTTYALTFIAMAGRGGVDLSIGPFMGFINVSSIQLYAAGYLQTPITWFVYAIAMGLLWQLFYALIVCFVRVSPIIVSLAGYLAFAGINIVILPRPGGIAPDWLLPWGEGFTILNPIFLLMILATILFYIITHTAFWGHLKLMGSDERAAFTSGVKINLVRIVAHMIAGIFAALSAICFTALVGSGDPLQGTKYTLLGITALVLGGASLVGGRGGAFGAILGALNLYLINYILVTFRFERLQSFVSDLSYGAVLVGALMVSLILPYVTRVTKGLSVMVFFILMAFAGLFVMIHQVYDQPIVIEQVVKNDAKSKNEIRGSIERKVDATGNIIVEVTGSSPGGENILINDDAKNSSFSVEISGSGLEVISANAKIPTQTIFESGLINLEADSNKVALATISGGDLVIDIDNYMSVTSDMVLSIPSLKDADGNNYQTNISISANSENNFTTTDISGYTLSMDISDQSIIYSYEVTTDDSGDDFIQIQSSDSIIVNMVLEGLEEGQKLLFSDFEGMVAPQDIGFNGQINVESDSDILEASLNQGSLIIDISNSISTSAEGAPEALITINQIVSAINNEPLVINTGPMFGVLESINVDLNGYKIIMPKDNQFLEYIADVQTVYEVGTYSLLDSIEIDINPASLLSDISIYTLEGEISLARNRTNNTT